MRINYFYLFYTHELKTSFPFDREKSLASRGHQLLARRELSKFPINPITYKRSRSRHNRCSLWRFDWTLIKHSLSVATANIPRWKVGRDRRYWFVNTTIAGVGKAASVFGADGDRDLPFEGNGERDIGKSYVLGINRPFSPLTLDVMYPLHPFSIFITIPWISRWARIAARPGRRPCWFRGDFVNANLRVSCRHKMLRERPHVCDT